MEQDGTKYGNSSPSVSEFTQGEGKKFALFLSPFSLLPPLTMLWSWWQLYSPGPTGLQWALPVFPIKIREKSWEHYPNSPRIWTDTCETNRIQDIFWNWDRHPICQEAPRFLHTQLGQFQPISPVISWSIWWMTGIFTYLINIHTACFPMDSSSAVGALKILVFVASSPPVSQEHFKLQCASPSIHSPY